MGAEVMKMGLWGTWEELLLGGAVLRHGTRDWNLVAAELRARTVCSYTFTPEACKARYEDLQQRYSGRKSKAWFEELRKQRMKELRRALELSENSIGSLESRLECLKAERVDDCRVDNYSSQTESPVPFQKSEAVLSSSKEISKDGLSAGSFTRETRANWSTESQIPAAVPAEETDVKPEVSRSSEQEKVSSIEKLTEIVSGVQGRTLRRKRGKRKRKYCSKDVKEGSVGESDFLSVADTTTASQCKENSTSESGQIARSSAVDDQSGSSRKDTVDDIKGIFESIAQNQSAFVFRRRLDSQKRGRYKKMILRHMDLDTIRSRISSHSITSAKELFRDLLLLANNGVVFYSKNTREYKSAFLLRALVIKTFRQHFKDYKPTTSIPSSGIPMYNKPPVKPRSARPGNHKPSGKLANPESLADKTPRNKRTSNTDSPLSEESLAVTVTKTGSDKMRKGGRGNGSQQRTESLMRGRKRTRAR
ncbi:hypothetical protein Dsin_027630 [Dipteronia sinensis]|uniref:Bromo domain-containing protein n=1 Tax=Dipteronia sinensis TaxID=43782 RepID=A0AAD9ZPJ7_9ROSI|nr:hypothetical protein Dsin_027630 [Dipteronia sinensis]